VGSFDRHVHPDEPDRPDRRDAAADRLSPPRETEAQLAERLGLSGLTRAAAYESLYAKAHAQDAPFRERLAREEREEREESAQRRESLTESADSPSPPDPPDPPDPPKEKPERNLEATRSYWTEVPRFLAFWGNHQERWPEIRRYKADRPIRPERSTETAESLKEMFQAEPTISDNVKDIAKNNARRGWLEGFEFRLKGENRLVEKVAESLETSSPDAATREIVQQIPDAIRYTFCLRSADYTAGCKDIAERLKGSGNEMYYSKNFWADPEYKGINTRWVTPQGQRFEVQFHTRESFHAKHHVTHGAYERLRNPLTSSGERVELSAFQREVSSWIPIPSDVTQIPDYKKEGF
jgi:hypothetical protein